MLKPTSKRAVTERGGDGFRARGILLGVLACLAAFFVVGCSGRAGPQIPQERAEPSATAPNIVFVLVDNLDFVSARKMPEIGSSLAEEGASFEK